MSNAATRQQLVNVKAKIAQGWNRNAYALDRKGNIVRPESEEAVSWCLAGAFSACGYNYDSPAWRLIRDLIEAPLVFNDEKCTSQADMLSFLDMAIQTA